MTIIGGVEQRVNSTIADIQTNGVVTALGNGGWVVAWQSLGQDGSGYGIYQQRYDAGGVKVGGETPLASSFGVDDGRDPAIASLANGGWVIVWKSEYASSWSPGWVIEWAAYNADGSESANRQTGAQLLSAIEGLDVVGLSGGGFATAWNLPDGATDIIGYTFGGGVGFYTTVYNTQPPKLMAFDDGGALLVSGYGESEISMYGVGSAKAGAISSSQVTNMSDGSAPDISRLPDGGWLVAWAQATQSQDGSDIYFQRYSATGMKVGGATLASETTAGDQGTPLVVALANGGWVVVWTGPGDGDGLSIYQRLYDSSGQAIGGDSLVNVTTSGDQSKPAVTALKDGSWIVTWNGAGVDDDSGVFQRIFSRADFDAVGRDGVVSVDHSAPYTFSGFDFQNDVDPTSSIIFTEAPPFGGLWLDGQPVVAGQAVAAADIIAGRLTWSLGQDVADPGRSLSFVVLDAGEIWTGDEVPNVLAFNFKPKVEHALPDQVALEDAAFSYTIPPDTIFDLEGGLISYSATLADGRALPYWLKLNAQTGEFYGTPVNYDVGTLSIKLIASDEVGASAELFFDIEVENTYDPPSPYYYSISFPMKEDEYYNYNFVSNYFYIDPAHQALSFHFEFSDGSRPDWASVDMSWGSARAVITPGNDAVGSHQLWLVAEDDIGGIGKYIWNITVENVNDAPTLANPIADQSATEDTDFSFQFASGVFSEIDAGDVLTFTATLANGDPLPSWLTFDAATRTFSGKPGNDDVGSISITVTAKDRAGESVTDTFSITTVNVNDAPHVVHAIADQSGKQDEAFSFTFAADMFDDVDIGDSANLTYSAKLASGEPLPSWLSFDAATRTFSGTPANGDVGTLAIEVEASDGNGGVGSEIFQIVIANVNDAPTLANPIADQSATEDALFSFQFSSDVFADIDAGDAFVYTATLANGDPLPSWLLFNPETRTFSGVPDNDDVGSISISITVTATDSGGAAVDDTFTITTANANDAPHVANAIADQPAIEDKDFSFTFAANAFGDIDIGDSLTYVAMLANGNPLPAWLSFDPATRTFAGTPDNDDVGTISITVTATDSDGAEVTDTFTITTDNTNDAPHVANGIADQPAIEDEDFSFTFAANAFGDVDIGDSLTYTAMLASGEPLPAWLSFDPATRTFAGTPGNDDVGSLAIKVVASDVDGETTSDTFAIIIANANDAPTLAHPIADQSATEDAPFSFQFASNVFADIDAGDSFVYIAALANGDPLPSWLSFDASTRTFAGTPENDDVGTISITVTATDSDGAEVTDTFTITTDNTNDAPHVVNAIADQAATQDEAFTFIFAADTFDDVDVGDSGSLAYTAQLANGDPLPSWLSFDADTRTFSGTPANSNVGTLSVEVIAADGNGGAKAAAFNIVIANVNDAPHVVVGYESTEFFEDRPFSLTLESGIFDDIDVGDTLTYSAKLANGMDLPSWLIFDAVTQTLSGMAGQDAVGGLLISITATDSEGASASAELGLWVNEVNDAPSASGRKIRIDEDTRHTFQAADFGFSDSDGNAFQSIIIGELPAAGTLLLDGQAVEAGKEILVADLSKLSWGARANDNGDGYARMTFSVVDDGGVAEGGVDRSADLATITFDVTEVVDRFIGGAGKQKLKGTSGDDLLSGGRGNDVLTGGKGSDIFVFKTGFDRDRITDFEAKGSDHDILDISGLKSVTSFRDLMKNHVEVTKAGIVIDGGQGDVVVLEGVKRGHLDAGDFLF